MKVHLNLVDFYDNISPQLEIIDSDETFTKLIPIGKSGIHIKEKNKGSFTSYCGGKVTDACIQKGKNSPSASIRKKATFADNARKWKHQFGGTLTPDVNKLIPMSTRTDISDLFVDYDTPSNFTSRKLKEESKENEGLGILDNLDYYFGESPVSSVVKPKTEETPAEETTTIYTGNETETLTGTPLDPQQQGFQSSRDVDFSTINLPTDWKDVLSKHLGKLAGPMGSWRYDCSNFVSRVYRDRGVKNLWGNCRTLYRNTDHLQDYSLAQLGDLIFFKGTQRAERGLGAELPSHVAIVLDTSRLPEGFITVAQGSPDTKTTVKELNLNQGYYKDHYLGIGKIKSAKLGMKFQFGGFIPKSVSELFVSDDSKKHIPIDYSPLFEENKKNSKKSELDYLSFLNLHTPSVVKELLAIEEEEPIIVYQQPELTSVEQTWIPSYSGSNYNLFKSEFNKYTQKDPSAKLLEPVLTRIAKHESNFNLSILNTAGAPAYGWFLFWQDGKLNNITHYSGLDIESFRHDPQAQISSAVKMAKSIMNSFNSQDLKMAKAKGYSMNALIRGAWLGGVNGVRQVLRGIGNPSDNKWYNNGRGRSVKQAMDEENQYNV